MKTNTTLRLPVTFALAALLLSPPCLAEAVRRWVNPMPRRYRVKAGQRLAKGSGLLAFFLLSVSTAFAQGTAFTYQGRLNDGTNVANGSYDLKFTVYDALADGNAVGGPLTNTLATDSNGLFTVTLDFGAVFDGSARWLEIAARTNGPGSPGFTTLSPRQSLTPVPYAITANNLSGTLPAAQVTGAIPASQLSGTVADSQLSPNVALLNGSPAFSGTVTASAFSGDGSALTNLNAANLASGTIPNARLSTNVALLNTNQTFTGSNNFTGVVTLTNTANTIAGNGAGLTNLNASKISTGTIPDVRLSTNVALLNTNQTFTGSNNFTGVVTLTNTANTIAGNGAGLTNLNASKISTGTISDVRLSTNVARLDSGTYPDARLSSNVALLSSGVVTNGQGFSQGGSPLVLDLQASGATLTGELWPAMPKPWKIIYSGNPYPMANSKNYLSETNLLWIINDLVKNGPHSYLAALTNDGSQVALLLEYAWDGFRNTNWSWVERNLGTLTWDTNRFPSGLPWLCSVAHSNNITVLLIRYYATNITPATASSWICTDGGLSLQLWTNGVGDYPSNSGVHYVTVTTPDFAQGDMQELSFWGLDGIVAANCINNSYYQGPYMLGRALLQMSFPLFWCQLRPVSYQTVQAVTNLLSDYYPFQWDIPYPTAFSLGRPLPPVLILGETLAGQHSHSMGYLTSPNCTGVFYDANGQGTGATGLRNIYRDFPVTKANQGAMVVWWGMTDNGSVIAQALSHGVAVDGWRNDPEWGGSHWTPWIKFATNTQWSAINQDSSQSWPRLKDYGTNVGSVWFTELSSGNWAVGIFNEGATTNTFTVNWADLSWPTNLYVHVREILPAVKDWGTNLVSFATNMPAGSSALFEFDEVAPLQPGGTLSGNGAALTDLNAANLASGTVADARLSTNVNLRSANQTLTGSNNFAGVVTLTNTANSIVGNGAGLTSLNADQLTSGTVPLARLPDVVVTNNATGVILSGTFTGDGGGLTNLNAALLEGQPASAFATAGHMHNFTNISGTVADEQLSTNVTLLNTSPAFAGTVTATGFSGDGSTLTNLNADQLTSGIVADARLSTNVALLGADQTFAGSNNFAGVVTLTNTANTIAGTFTGNGTGLTNIPFTALPAVPLTNNQGEVAISGAFIGDGAGLTNLNTTNLVGIVADVQLSGNVVLLNTSPAFAGTVTATGFSGDGSTLTNLNADQLASGTVPDAHLSTNVALLNGSPVFSAPVTMSSFLSLARTTIIPADGSTIIPASSHVLLNPAAAVALNAVTAIASGTRTGDVLVLQGNSDENTVTVPNNANTKLTAASHVLGANDMLVLLWTGTAWTELSFANN